MNEFLTIGEDSHLTIGEGEFLTLGVEEDPSNSISFNLNFVLEWTREFLKLTIRLPFK